MALKATIYKAEIIIADMDRHYYETHNLTIARHPSETDERMMVRLLSFALNAHESLNFTKGISSEGEPDLWQKSLSGEINLWIDLGLPSEKRVRQACGKAEKVIVYCYGGRTAVAWWDKIQGNLGRFKNLEVINLSKNDTELLMNMSNRSMQLQINIQDGDVFVNSGMDCVDVKLEKWKG